MAKWDTVRKKMEHRLDAFSSLRYPDGNSPSRPRHFGVRRMSRVR